MENLFQLMMVRLMLNRKGFTLIETLFVLSIICILCVLTMTLHIPQKSEKVELNEIVSFLNEAKMNAMISKQTTTIHFSHHQITYSSAHQQKSLKLNKENSFEDYQMTFNENGNIKTAKTILYHTKNHDYRFVYQVGSGCFYVE